HREYFTLSAFIDFSATSGKLLDVRDPVAEGLRNQLQKLSRGIADRTKELRAATGGQAGIKELTAADLDKLHELRFSSRWNFAPIYQSLYHDVWENFTADIIQAARRASGGGIDSGPHSIGSVSAEFRGLSVTLSEHVRREEIREPLTEYIREPGWSD